jgi:hypothetical protein
VVLEKAWPGTTLNQYSLAVRVGVSDYHFSDSIMTIGSHLQNFDYEINFIEVASVGYDLPSIEYFSFKKQKWTFPREEFILTCDG